LSDKYELRCICGIISSDDNGNIIGWLVSKKLPNWVGDFVDWVKFSKNNGKASKDEEGNLN
jgi:hypothetical protein